MGTIMASRVAMAKLALRMMCGLFYLPHILFKVLSHDIAVGFFEKAGFAPARVFVILAAVVESLCAIGLICGIYTRVAALVSSAVLAVAATSVISTSGLRWVWNLGGIEYPVFWALACLVVALLYWDEE